MKNLSDYKIGDNVEVFMGIGNRYEWRKGTVVGVNKVYPQGRERHKPYIMLIVECIRTYFNAKTQKYYDKINREGFVYDDHVR